MKSTERDNIVRTSCKNCIFAIYDGKTQKGCQANRLEKIEEKFEAYDDDKEFYVLERFCNYYRENKEKYLKYGIINTQLVREEAKVNFLVFCMFDDVNEDKMIDLQRKIQNILSKYGKDKIEFYLCHKNMKERKIVEDVILSLDVKAICHFDKKFLQKVIMKTNKSFHIIFDESNIEKISIILDVNSLINEDMKKFTVAKKGDVLAISNLAYKVSSLKKESLDYDKVLAYVIKESKKRKLYEEVL